MANEKYFGTNLHLSIPKEILNKYNATNNHNQFRIVCKAKSLAAAERTVQGILEANFKIFRRDYTSETGNKSEIEYCDMHIAIIALDNMQREYQPLKEIYDEVQEFRKSMK